MKTLVFFALTLLLASSTASAQERLCGPHPPDAIKQSLHCYFYMENGEYKLVPERDNPFVQLTLTNGTLRPGGSVELPKNVQDKARDLGKTAVIKAYFTYYVPRNTTEATLRKTGGMAPACVVSADYMSIMRRAVVDERLQGLRSLFGTPPGKNGASTATAATIGKQSVMVQGSCNQSPFRKGDCFPPIDGYVFRHKSDGSLRVQFFRPADRVLDSSPSFCKQFNLSCPGPTSTMGPNFRISGSPDLDGVGFPDALRYQIGNMDRTQVISAKIGICPFEPVGVAEIASGRWMKGCVHSLNTVTLRKKDDARTAIPVE